MKRKVKTALISVSDKTGIESFARFLSKSGVVILSTGGTANVLRKQGIAVKDIAEITGFPEMMDGRVKTLHPKVHGGLLARRDLKEHRKAMKKHGITSMDMVVVNLYPFEKTIAQGADYEEAIESIDIGGPSMLRSAAKNHEYVTVITDPADYEQVQAELRKHNGATTFKLRSTLAARAFQRTAAYDAAISRWFAEQSDEIFPERLNASFSKKQTLRYGENPHQQAALYVDNSQTPGVANAQQLQGKELSYNNIADTDAAFELVNEFEMPAVAIIKHANPCGVATAKTLSEAYQKALAADPVSAYGSIIAFNRKVDAKVAELLSHLFVEVVISSGIEKEAQRILLRKKNLRVLITDTMPDKNRHELLFKSVTGGLLMQERDFESIKKSELKVVTKRKPTKQETADLLFAWQVCKHVKSNAIVLAKDACAIGVGAGQMSRVDSVRLALQKAEETATHVKDAKGSVIASDAFFPFADGLELAAKGGITACIQPGGSVRDEEVIATADKYDVAMVFTGKRHFRH